MDHTTTLLIIGIVSIAIGIFMIYFRNSLADKLGEGLGLERWWAARQGLDYAEVVRVKFLFTGMIFTVMGAVCVFGIAFRRSDGSLPPFGSVCLTIGLVGIFVLFILYFFSVERMKRR